MEPLELIAATGNPSLRDFPLHVITKHPGKANCEIGVEVTADGGRIILISAIVDSVAHVARHNFTSAYFAGNLRNKFMNFIDESRN